MTSRDLTLTIAAFAVEEQVLVTEHTFSRRVEIDDLAFAHSARRRLADAKNLDVAVAPALADDGAHLRCANFQAYDDVFFSH